MIGDSLIAGWPPDLATNAINFRVGGDHTQMVLWRMDDAKLVEIEPRLAVILAGTNNLSYSAPACSIVAGIEAIVARARSLWPTANIAVIEIPPRGENFLFRDDERRQINAELRTLASRYTPMVAINLDNQLTCGHAPNCSMYMDDYLHFTPEGYEILSSAIPWPSGSKEFK
jgi:lysophospholipase L1-like esterase